jgi:type IV secretion system protein VirB5
MSEFNKPLQDYGTNTDKEGIFARVKQIWQGQFTKLISERDGWKKGFFLAMFFCLILVACLIYVCSKSSVIPYVIEVDSQTGMARNVGVAKEGQYSPKDAEIKHFVGQFVEKVRAIPTDKVVYDDNWIYAKKVMTSNAASKMSQLISNDAMLKDGFGKLTVLPQVINVLPVTKDTYQVRWSEEYFVPNRGVQETHIMTGLFTIQFGKPTNEQDLYRNPLGIFINDFSWSSEKK